MGSVMQRFAPTPTDYTTQDSWVMFYDDRGCEADTFYLYPTMGHKDKKAAFCEAYDLAMCFNIADVAPTQILPWLWATNLYAPLYRQASFAGLLPAMNPKRYTRQEGFANVENFLREEAMEDIYAALDYFFENQNKGKPFFLVSHSQGSVLMKIALEEYFAQQHPELLERLVAAYCPGWIFTADWCERVGLPLCSGAEDTGVLATWNCERPTTGSDPRTNAFSLKGALCVNPVTWSTSTTPSNPDDNLGSLVLDAEQAQALENALLSAYSVEQGFFDSEEEYDEEIMEAIMLDEKRIEELAEYVRADDTAYEWNDPETLDDLWRSLFAPGEEVVEPPFAVKHGFVSAWVDPERGTLSVDYPDEHAYTPRVLGSTTLHMLDHTIFFEDVRKNVSVRLAAWLAKHNAQ